MHGFGPVRPSVTDPPFHEPWEGRVHGMMVALIAARARGAGSFRYAIETMGNERYLTTSYYEHWLAALETLLENGGILDPGALDARMAEGRFSASRRADPALAAQTRALLTTPGTRTRDGPEPRFGVGAAVRVRGGELSHAGHCRCPRYVRGRPGEVVSVLPLEPWPEGLPEGRVDPVPCYTVRFRSTDLWGEAAEPFDVTVDLVEPYLEAADA
jgi:nitrile hydratase